ncbi:MAG: hypothetical protein ACI92B_001284 [Marinobacter maritimus]|jgi:hypothetical protein|tara:strand:- start:1250 stop:1390 length:141 start_codon:yes stop_codon:yes gene_type:complete
MGVSEVEVGNKRKPVEKDPELRFCAKVIREYTYSQVLWSLVFSTEP